MTNYMIITEMINILHLTEKDSSLHSRIFPEIKQRSNTLIKEFARTNNMCCGCVNFHDMTHDGTVLCGSCSTKSIESFKYKID